MLICLSFAVQGQISSFSGSNRINGNDHSFYNPIIWGSKQFSNGFVSTGPVQLTKDTAAVLDTSILQYDLDSIPAQTVFYDNPCQFYIKSDSLNQINKPVKGGFYYITSGTPRGTFEINRLNLVQYLTSKDTLDFEVGYCTRLSLLISKVPRGVPEVM